MLRFGGLVFVGDTTDPVLLAKVHRQKGFTAAFAPPVKPSDTAAVRRARKA